MNDPKRITTRPTGDKYAKSIPIVPGKFMDQVAAHANNRYVTREQRVVPAKRLKDKE